MSRIEGMFRSTCEMVMSVLRDNKDSLMAMLEAFVHDPLISWRLLAQPRMSASPLVRDVLSCTWLSYPIRAHVKFLETGPFTSSS